MNDVTLDSIRDVRIYQRKDGYRFSVDALLLYSFIRLPRAGRIADIGAGSGIIGILLARRYRAALVVLIEIQDGLAGLAAKNVSLNGLEDRISVVTMDAGMLLHDQSPCGHLQRGGFDVVVCNPPFRRPDTGLLSRGDERAIARHELRLPLPSLLGAAAALLRHHGRYFMIHLPERLAEVTSALKAHTLEPKRMRFVHSHRNSVAKMVLLEMVKGGRSGLKVEPPLFIYEEGITYSDEMREICGGSEDAAGL
jgi:tRNA1Val (adenine37-N6)-methyltransferase